MVACAFIWLAALAGAEPNLLTNPGFEIEQDSQPADWALYVKPKPGAEGGLDREVFSEGSHAIRLRTAEAYPEEPANNWSQNLLRNLSGETLVVGGLIKTENASGADIWLQCWRRNPWGVLYVAHTSDTHPISGTTEWTPVAMKVAVPKDTDFVTIRCVLKGKGTAWFDDLRVTDVTASASTDKEVKAMSDDLAKGNSPSAATGEAKRENLPPVPREEPKKEDIPAASKEDAKVDILREAESLADTLRSLKESNEVLRKELGEVRDELKDVRGKLEKAQRASAGPNANKPAPSQKPKPARRVPPLVPRGFDWEDLPDAL